MSFKDKITKSVVKALSFEPNCAAIGGQITYSGSYTIHTFTSSGFLTVLKDIDVEVMCVGGGSGGSGPTIQSPSHWDNWQQSGNGGGGGTVRFHPSYSLSLFWEENVPVIVGNGGAGSAVGYYGFGTYHHSGPGQESKFGTFIASGGLPAYNGVPSHAGSNEDYASDKPGDPSGGGGSGASGSSVSSNRDGGMGYPTNFGGVTRYYGGGAPGVYNPPAELPDNQYGNYPPQWPNYGSGGEPGVLQGDGFGGYYPTTGFPGYSGIVIVRYIYEYKYKFF